MSKRDLVEKRKDQGRELFNPAKMLALKKGKRYPKKHGAIMVYTDSAPNLSVHVNGQRVLNFHLGRITSFIPSHWVARLEALAAPILAAEKLKEKEQAKKREADYLARFGVTE